MCRCYNPRAIHLFLAIYRGYQFQSIEITIGSGPMWKRSQRIARNMFTVCIFFLTYITWA